jgi:Flp pilus assembly protein TadG
MRLPTRLARDQQGAAVVEMAITLPVIVSFIWGIFQLGLLFQANAGMQHALGEASRLATIFPTPTDDEIRNRVLAKRFGTYNGRLEALNIQTTNTGVAPYKDLTLVYSQPMNYLFFAGGTVTLTRSKRVYLPVDGTPTPPSCSTPGGGGGTCTTSL